MERVNSIAALARNTKALDAEAGAPSDTSERSIIGTQIDGGNARSREQACCPFRKRSYSEC